MAQHGYLRDWDERFGGDDRDRGDWRDRDERDWRSRGREGGFMFGEEDRERFRDRDEDRSFSSHADDHYRSWRDRQMQALDNDYADYCREREQQFHRDFDSWRSQRHSNPQPLQTGMTQSGLSGDPSGELQLTTEDQSPLEPGQDPTAAATLGTTSGRRR